MLTVKNLTKVFRSKPSDVVALHKINLSIEEGQFVLIKGPSGCGKSTLLFTLGGMLQPSYGEVLFNGKDIYQASSKELLYYRARHIGFVYQSYHLIPYLTIMENILLVNKTANQIVSRSEVIALAKEFNLEERLHHKPSELSVGEKQRAALLRALIVKPQIIIADEPTGNLDPDNSHIIMQHFKAFHENGGTIIMASHGTEADKLASIQLQMKEGELT